MLGDRCARVVPKSWGRRDGFVSIGSGCVLTSAFHGLRTFASRMRRGYMLKDERLLDKFREAARELERDYDPERFEERVRKLVKHKQVEKPE